MEIKMAGITPTNSTVRVMKIGTPTLERRKKSLIVSLLLGLLIGGFFLSELLAGLILLS
jgi:hypothetical protein